MPSAIITLPAIDSARLRMPSAISVVRRRLKARHGIGNWPLQHGDDVLAGDVAQRHESHLLLALRHLQQRVSSASVRRQLLGQSAGGGGRTAWSPAAPVTGALDRERHVQAGQLAQVRLPAHRRPDSNRRSSRS
jgi:hypothetical protein